jgi:GNAT superfamily N-acetyltransferase
LEFGRQVTLRDGRVVDVRPVVPDDAAELGEAIRTADPDTRNRRFLGGPPPVTTALLEYLTVLDYRTRFALVARARVAGRGVGIARFERVGDGVAEVAVVVEPGWRRVGLATALIHLLGAAALARGISTFNRPVAALLVDAGAGGAGFISDGIAQLKVALAGGSPG